MKKITSLITAGIICLSLTACSSNDEFNKNQAYENMRKYYSEDFENEDFYLQISKTKAEAHVMTEASKYGDDCVFLEYDVQGALKYYRNKKLTHLAPETFFQVETSDAQWSDFSYQKTADTYRSVLNTLSSDEYSSDDSKAYAVKEVTVEETKDKSYPYKVSAHFDTNKINTKELFASGGNFGSISIKFLTDEKGESFDDISIYVQYDYNDEIFVISSKYGEPNLPDEKGDNGQRPEDIEKEYEQNLEELQATYLEYLKQFEASYNN